MTVTRTTTITNTKQITMTVCINLTVKTVTLALWIMAMIVAMAHEKEALGYKYPA